MSNTTNKAAMNLKLWLEAEERTSSWLARKIGASVSHGIMLTSGQRIPSLRYAVAIKRLTGIQCEAWIDEPGSVDAT